MHIACILHVDLAKMWRRRFRKKVAEHIPHKYCGADSAKKSRNRFRLNVVEQISQKLRGRFCKNIPELVHYLLQKCSLLILYHEELSIGDALITHFVSDYPVRVYINQSRDCRFFLAFKPNRETLIELESERYATYRV